MEELPYESKMSVSNASKNDAEKNVEDDLRKHYPSLTELEFWRVEKIFDEWWVSGHFTVQGKVKGFIYRLDGITGKINGYEII